MQSEDRNTVTQLIKRFHGNQDEYRRGGGRGSGRMKGRNVNRPNSYKPQQQQQQHHSQNKKVFENKENTNKNHSFTKIDQLPSEIKNMDFSEFIQQLDAQQKQSIISRFPSETVKLSYETVTPKKVSSTEYDLCVAIPFGKRAYIWFSYYYYNQTIQHVCYVLELNRENQISDQVRVFSCKMENNDIYLGTVFSGIIYEEPVDTISEVPNTSDEKVFLIEDIHMYKGQNISKWTFMQKSGALFNALQQNLPENILNFGFYLKLAVMWESTKEQPLNIPYNIRHIQYRSTNQILPHLNFLTNRKPGLKSSSSLDNLSATSSYSGLSASNYKKYIIDTNIRFNYNNAIYKKNVVFWVKADIAYDVYYLGALNPAKQIVYCQYALVLNYKCSVMLNKIFRNIRENECLDRIEDSDEEEDFEDIREDKYVDLNKEILMECYFHPKFKKWVPVQEVQQTNDNIFICTVDLL